MISAHLRFPLERPAGSLRRLDLEHPHERRLVLLVERDDVDYAEALGAAADDLLARLDLIAYVASTRPMHEHVHGSNVRRDAVGYLSRSWSGKARRSQ